jgi:hypothetical protein
VSSKRTLRWIGVFVLTRTANRLHLSVGRARTIDGRHTAHGGPTVSVDARQ